MNNVFSKKADFNNRKNRSGNSEIIFFEQIKFFLPLHPR